MSMAYFLSLVTSMWIEFWSEIFEIFCGDSNLGSKLGMEICIHKWFIDWKIQSYKGEKPKCGQLLKMCIQ